MAEEYMFPCAKAAAKLHITRYYVTTFSISITAINSGLGISRYKLRAIKIDYVSQLLEKTSGAK